MDRDTCLLCGERGHRAKDCPNRGNAGAQGDRRRAFNSFVGAPNDDKPRQFEEDDDFVGFSLEECKGYALLDGGASRSVGGVEQLEHVNDGLEKPMKVSMDQSLGFTFAGGDRAEAPSRVSFAVKDLDDEKVEIFVLDRPSPVLLGIDMLKRYELVIDYGRNTVYSHKLKKNIPAKILTCGHLAINLTALGNAGPSSSRE